jgi:hypothetical protein
MSRSGRLRGRQLEVVIRCLRLITWNATRLGSRILEQATALARREPDLIALQEVTRRTLRLWRSAFQFMGPVHARRRWTKQPRDRQPPQRQRDRLERCVRTPQRRGSLRGKRDPAGGEGRDRERAAGDPVVSEPDGELAELEATEHEHVETSTVGTRDAGSAAGVRASVRTRARSRTRTSR